jgi:hypothetical protein
MHRVATLKAVTFASFGNAKGTCATGFTADPSCNSNHTMAVVTAACVGKQDCSIDASCQEFHERLMQPNAFCWDVVKSLAVQVTCKAAQVPLPQTTAGNTTAFLADFGREFQGGLRLTVEDGTAGQTVDIACGEAWCSCFD